MSATKRCGTLALGGLALLALALAGACYYLALPRAVPGGYELVEHRRYRFRTDRRALAQAVIMLQRRAGFTPGRKAELVALLLPLQRAAQQEAGWRALLAAVLRPEQQRWLQAYLARGLPWVQPAGYTHPFELLARVLDPVPARIYDRPLPLTGISGTEIAALCTGVLALRAAPPGVRLTPMQLGWLKGYLVAALPACRAEVPALAALAASFTPAERAYLEQPEARFNPGDYRYPYGSGAQDPDVALALKLLRPGVPCAP